MSKPKRILYRGVPMIEGWPEKIIAAQQVVSLTLEGRDVPRIRYGDEQSDWQAASVPCHDCGILMGEFHVPNCDVEECPACHDQLISCECPFDDRAEDAPDNTGIVHVDFQVSRYLWALRLAWECS